MYSESGAIFIENRCTSCISHITEEFVRELFDSTRRIKGFVGTISPLIKKGTLQWKWEDDIVTEQKLLIPNSYYVPSGKCRLLIPQH